MPSASKPKQKSITSFFAPKENPENGVMTNKRKKAPETETEDIKKAKDEMAVAKKTKSDNIKDDPQLREEYEKIREKLSALLGGGRDGRDGPEMGLSWFNALKPAFNTPSINKLNAFLTSERKGSEAVYPPAEHVWSCTRYFPIQETKVVILGQDPYHGPKQAHGLCFSVSKGVAIPPSLLNMYKELKNEYGEDFNSPSHGYLLNWSKQGVLLLNAVLTVTKGKANSHKDKGWEAITDKIISYISQHCNNVVFLLWGASAQKKAQHVDSKKHHLLKSVHPSPLSAHRGFLGCGHFKKCNDFLEKIGKEPVDWNAINDE